MNKYSLTLHDLSAAQVTDLVNRFGAAEINTIRQDNVIPLNPSAPATIPAAAPAPANPAADANALLNASNAELSKSASIPGDVDSENLPWDGRIHSGSKKKNADGKWKLLKKVDDALVASVKAELHARAAAPAPAAPVAIPTPTAPANLGNGQPAAHATAPATVPATSGANVIPAGAPAPIMAAPLPITRDFSGLMQQISKLFATKQITPDYPTTIVQRINTGFNSAIATLTDVQNDPRMVEYAWQCLEVDQKAA